VAAAVVPPDPAVGVGLETEPAEEIGSSGTLALAGDGELEGVVAGVLVGAGELDGVVAGVLVGAGAAAIAVGNGSPSA